MSSDVSGESSDGLFNVLILEIRAIDSVVRWRTDVFAKNSGLGNAYLSE